MTPEIEQKIKDGTVTKADIKEVIDQEGSLSVAIQKLLSLNMFITAKSLDEWEKMEKDGKETEELKKEFVTAQNTFFKLLHGF